MGSALVANIDFRVRPPRRGMQSAPGGSDEADRIEDPVLRGIYRAARKKALA
jgi:hypothetical protein